MGALETAIDRSPQALDRRHRDGHNLAGSATPGEIVAVKGSGEGLRDVDVQTIHECIPAILPPVKVHRQVDKIETILAEAGSLEIGHQRLLIVPLRNVVHQQRCGFSRPRKC